MPVLAGWLTGEQVPQEVIEQTLTAMGEVLARHGGEPARNVQAGAGLIAFADHMYAQQHGKEPPVLDWVPDRRTLVYRRPLSGMHPLFYIENWPAEGNLLFASEIKALLAVGVPRRLHLAALDTLFHYGFIPAPWTAFKDIHVVPAGSILRWQHAKIVVNQAGDFALGSTHTTTQSPEHLETLLKQACNALLPTHNHLVALVSGSRASSLTAALTAQQNTHAVSIASLGISKKLTAKGWQEVQRVTTAHDLPLLAITGVDQPEFWRAALTGLEAPCSDTRPLAIHQLLHTISAETGARVALTGLGAETILGMKNQLASKSMVSDQATAMLHNYHQLLSTQHKSPANAIWSQDARISLQANERWEDTLHAKKLQRKASRLTATGQGLHYLDLHLRLPDALVQPFHQLAMQERMAIRSPYLQVQVMEALLESAVVLANDPTQWQQVNQLVQRAIPDMPVTPATLPLHIPTTSLLQTTGADIITQTIAPAAIQQIGLFDSPTVEKILKRDRQAKKASSTLIFIFTTQLLAQLFSIEGWS